MMPGLYPKRDITSATRLAVISEASGVKHSLKQSSLYQDIGSGARAVVAHILQPMVASAQQVGLVLQAIRSADEEMNHGGQRAQTVGTASTHRDWRQLGRCCMCHFRRRHSLASKLPVIAGPLQLLCFISLPLPSQRRKLGPMRLASSQLRVVRHPLSCPPSF